MCRVFDWLMRHLVRWLRRHRYARMAGRISWLELELGMREPTATERGFQALAEALGAPRVTQHATGGGRNYFANGDMTIGPTATDGFSWPEVPKLPPFTPDPRLTARTSE